jgi:uncharacterized protein YjbJ (UPF0337 family)
MEAVPTFILTVFLTGGGEWGTFHGSNKGFTMMKRSTKDKAKGIFHEWKGTIKGKAGKLTNNPGLEAKGIVEKIAGKIQRKLGQVEKTVEKP